MSKELKLKLTDEQAQRLKAAAHDLKMTPAALAATFVEEGLRSRKYSNI